MGMLRRVQPYLDRGAVGGGDVGKVSAGRNPCEEGVLLAGGRRRGEAEYAESAPEPLGGLLHHDEPRLCGPYGAAGQPEGAVPRNVDGGAGLLSDHGDHADLERLHVCAAPGAEVHDAVLAEQRTVVESLPLRLGPPRHHRHLPYLRRPPPPDDQEHRH